MKMSLIITFFVALATYILIILYYKFFLNTIGGPIGLDGFIIIIIPILLTVIIGIVIILMNTKDIDVKILNIVLYIILTVASLWITSSINDKIDEKDHQALINGIKTLYKEVSEKGELLDDNKYWSELYYYNDNLYDISYNNYEVSLIFDIKPNVNINENDYIRVYEVNKKYILMLAKSALNTFDNWIMYVNNVGYFRLENPDMEPMDDMFGVVERIIKNNKYIILDKDIDTKLQEKWKSNLTEEETIENNEKTDKLNPDSANLEEKGTFDDDEKTDEFKPDSADTFINMGYEYYNKKEYKKAKECYEKAKGIMVK